ncbi:MAG: type VII secretion protein EccB [Nocardioides sp.]
MATKKDLVEAHAFSRRRLVTAFVSGAPGGREVEPARPGRTIVGGLALAVLLIAGAAIAGIFSPSVDEDWADQPGLVISKETGAAYVITDGAAADPEDEGGSGAVLRPVINITSAMLILGADIAPEIVPQKAIDAQTIGDDIGILNAPASVPSPSLLIDTGWTACTNEGRGTRVNLTATPGAKVVDGGGFVVESDGQYYVIAQGRQEGDATPRAHSYALPSGGGQDARARDAMLAELGLPPAVEALRVPGEWLALFPAGGALDVESFQTEAGGSLSYVGGSSGIPPDARAGDVVEEADGSDAYLLTEQGPAPLDAFSLAVYRSLPAPDTPTVHETDSPVSAVFARQPYLDAHWPDTTLEPVPGEACALLQPEAGSVPAVQIAADPSEEASAYDVSSGQRSVRVDPGRGSYVISGGWNDTTEGSPYLVDAKGVAYPLVGAGTADLLGYGGYDAPVVPDTWIELFDSEVSLSQEQALCPPDIEAGRTCD